MRARSKDYGGRKADSVLLFFKSTVLGIMLFAFFLVNIVFDLYQMQQSRKCLIYCLSCYSFNTLQSIDQYWLKIILDIEQSKYQMGSSVEKTSFSNSLIYDEEQIVDDSEYQTDYQRIKELLRKSNLTRSEQLVASSFETNH